ncbi:MAG: lipopolysaccharide biosynthesis protein [Planctomycetes bacterium]|nr:lipopolysaccharide biosynthesis protein [Planctomycetota bacterium]
MDSLTNPEPQEKSHSDLFKRSVKGSFWVFALRLVVQIVSFGRWIVLARFLAVEDMGLLGIGMLTMQILATFTNTGFHSALIQKKGNIDQYLNTAWVTGIVRALLIYAVLYFIAPYVTMLKVSADKVDMTVSLIRVIGLSLVINSLTNVATVYFAKELQFYKQFVFGVCGTLTDAVVTIVIVVCYKSVWAMVAGKLAGSVVRLILSYILFSFKPSFEFDLAKAKQLWGFGKWVFLGTLIYFIMSDGDDLFVWSYLGVSSLALYQMAYKLCNIPAIEIASVVNQITFPAYSKLQDDLPRLKDAYVKVLKVTSIIAFPVTALIFILTPEFVSIFLTDRWTGIIMPMRVMAVLGLTRMLKVTMGPIFYALGKPGIMTKINIVKLAVLVIMIYPLTALWGITGTALTVFLVCICLIPVELYIFKRIIDCGVTKITSTVFPAFVSTVAMLGVSIASKKLFFEGISFLSFFTVAALGSIAYIATLFIFDRVFKSGIFDIITEQVNVFMESKSVDSELDAENIYDETIN